MENRSLLLKDRKTNLITNSLIDLGLEEDEGKGKGRYFVSKFIESGLAHYKELGDILITKETLDKFIQTMVGCPVIIDHVDVTDKNVDKLRVGVISRVWYNEMDGWYYCEGIITDNEAINLIKNEGWSVSCSYSFVSDDTKKTYHGKPIDMEFTDGEFLHLAIVKEPRYEGANIVVNSKVKNEDKWITVKPNGEENKGKHLLIKEGETPKEAIERTYGKDEKSDTKEKQSGSKGEKTKENKNKKPTESKKYNYTLTKREVEDRKMLGGMADTGNYYTNGDFAIDKKYLNIKGQEPTKKEEIEKPLKNILQGDSTYRYTPVKDFEIGELKREYGKPIKVAKYSYYDEKYGYERNIYLNKKYNDFFKNFDLKFGGETEPVFAYKGKDIVGVVMPINAREQSYSKVENVSEEEYEYNKEQLTLKGLKKDEKEKEPKTKNANNSIDKENILMSVMEDLKDFILGVVNNEKEDEMKVKNEDKRKLIDEIGGILKDKVDDEIIRTVIKKAEELSYEPSEDDKADNKKAKNEDDEDKDEAKNKCKNEDDKEDKKEEDKEEDPTKNEDDDEEEKTENKKVKNSMKDFVMGGKSDYEEKSLYTSRAKRLEEGNKY